MTVTRPLNAHHQVLDRQIRAMSPTSRRVVGALFRDDTEPGDLGELYRTVGALIAAVHAEMAVDLLAWEHETLRELPAEAAGTIAEIEAADRERVAQWPPVDLDWPDDPRPDTPGPAR